MKKLFVFSAALLLASPLFAAESEAKAAVEKAAATLGEKPNFSWTSTSKSEAGASNLRQSPVEGQWEKGGYSHIAFSYNDNPVECAFKGNKSAIKMDTEWSAADELTGDREWIAARLRAFKAPVAEATELASQTQTLKKEADVYSGDLSPAGVKTILASLARGDKAPDAKDITGRVKFWVKDGELTKYEFNIQGKVSRAGEEVKVDRTTVVEIKIPGSTKIELPPEAKKKLS